MVRSVSKWEVRKIHVGRLDLACSEGCGLLLSSYLYEKMRVAHLDLALFEGCGLLWSPYLFGKIHVGHLDLACFKHQLFDSVLCKSLSAWITEKITFGVALDTGYIDKNRSSSVILPFKKGICMDSRFCPISWRTCLVRCWLFNGVYCQVRTESLHGEPWICKLRLRYYHFYSHRNINGVGARAETHGFEMRFPMFCFAAGELCLCCNDANFHVGSDWASAPLLSFAVWALGNVCLTLSLMFLWSLQAVS